MPERSSSPQAGFSILELVISLLIAVEILIAAAVVFDLHDRMARVQVQITDMQQSLRVAQYDLVRTLRMAGRGGLNTPFTVDAGPPVRLRGGAVEVRNNVLATDDSNQVAIGTDQPRAVPGSDILTIRGCIAGSLYQINPNNGVDFQVTGANTADILLSNPSPLGIPQCLRPLAEQLPSNGGSGLSGPVILGSNQDRSLFHVATITGAAEVDGDPMDCAAGAAPSSLRVSVDTTASTLSPAAFDPAMGVALVCQLEEYRYYAREVEGVIGPDSTPIAQPRLARARMNPGTELPFGGDAANLSLDIAEGIFDLQVAFGFDSDFPSTDPGTPGAFGDDLDNLGVDDQIFEAVAFDARDTDDWLYNHPDDDPAAPQWTAHQFPGNTGPVDLLYVRITLAARTARPDPRYVGGDIDGVDGDAFDFVEDNDYDSDPAQVWKQDFNRNFRRRLLQTVVDMRNQG